MAQPTDRAQPDGRAIDLNALSISGDRAPTDGELVSLCVAGSVAADRAYPVLIRRYQRRTIAQLFSLTRDLQAAEDLAHETFVTAFLALRALKDPQAFAAWLAGVAKNVYRKWVRDGKHRGRGLAGQSGEFGSASSAFGLEMGAVDPESDVRAVDERTRKAGLYADMYRILDGLPEPYREVLLTRYFEDLSCQEIADRLARPLNTVTKQLSRGHALLAEALTSLRGHTTTLSLWLPQAEVAAAEAGRRNNGSGSNGNGRQANGNGGAANTSTKAAAGARDPGRKTRNATNSARAKGGAV